MEISIRDQIIITCRRLLSQINRDPATRTFGCFDRRYWAWKMTDFPEATFQRNLNPLCWYLDQPESRNSPNLINWIKVGLEYSLKIQHRDGSFDQAYPQERSYGATAFLSPDLINVYQRIRAHLTSNEQSKTEERLNRSAIFLYSAAELHGTITNHLAGAVLALTKASKLFKNSRYERKAGEILSGVIGNQSAEGWFPEYGGADPGYQTLCMYYLAQVYLDNPTEKLRSAMEQSLDFLQYFVHPDGSFGGEYGSRRTEIYYPGGIALLVKKFEVAAQMHARMAASISSGSTTNLMDIDIGNTAPLLSNYILAEKIHSKNKKADSLPINELSITKFFKSAGILIQSSPKFYTILGVSNGGTVKIFNKKTDALVYEDFGVLGETEEGHIISNQATNRANPITIDGNSIDTSSLFYIPESQIPTPLKFILLRIGNLSFMRFRFINEFIKKTLVNMLINRKSPVPLKRIRKIAFNQDSITIKDKIVKTSPISIKRLIQGEKFSTIHMASSRYFSPSQLAERHIYSFDIETLQETGSVSQSILIDLKNDAPVQIK